MARTESRGQRAEGKGILVLFALCSLLFASTHRAPPSAAAVRRRAAAAAHPAIGNREAIAEGEKLYNETCTSCHGKDGTGGELGPPVAAQNRRYLRRTDQEIFDTIKNGITGTQMPPYAGQFTDDQVWRITGVHPRPSRHGRSTRPRPATSPAAKRSSGAKAPAAAAT